MRILVTGSEGTIGRPLCKQLRQIGHEVFRCDLQHATGSSYRRADVANYRQMQSVFDHFGEIDLVYHLAAEFGRINGEEYYDTLWQTNAIGTRNILELQRWKSFKLIFASSSEVYGNLKMGFLNESMTESIPIVQHNDYALTKWVNEVQIMNFERRYNTPIMRLRFFNAYGPGERYHDYRSVVCLFCYRALHGIPYEVYEGYDRVFMYIDDFIPTLAEAAERFVPGEVVNIGGHEYRSVRDLSDLILDTLGKDDSLVTYRSLDAHNIKSKRPNISKAKQLLGHNPKVTLEEGVPKTIDWMVEEYGL